ncbi:hypothetical protein CSOJ01_00752 [Colletotrichum sojae]|uniref:Uncharacterized protein n=1 Tax=Colletotrichum sojae TaxID=2175907 RepID=A0A8H6JXH3_9PEZI|nr:hypothetical protein CSOJ01_00752 [Colletotrichum sojae]
MSSSAVAGSHWQLLRLSAPKSTSAEGGHPGKAAPGQRPCVSVPCPQSVPSGEAGLSVLPSTGSVVTDSDGLGGRTVDQEICGTRTGGSNISYYSRAGTDGQS